MTSHPQPPEENFSQAEQDWDLPKLYADLASVNHKELTQTEKKYLRGLLLGYSPDEIAAKVSNRPDADSNSVRVTLTRGVYKPIKGLFNLKEISWGRVRSLLEPNYKKSGGELPTLLQMWEKLKTKASPTNKMGVVLAPQMATMGMTHREPSDYLEIVPLKSDILFKANLDCEGHLILLEKEPSEKVCCLCPSKYAPDSRCTLDEMTLPQYPASSHLTFTVTEPGKEELLAFITQELPPLKWLGESKQKVLKLDRPHLQELLEYLEGVSQSQVFYTEYRVMAS